MPFIPYELTMAFPMQFARMRERTFPEQGFLIFDSAGGKEKIWIVRRSSR